MKILLATDGSVYGEAAVRAVASQPWPANSEVRVISAVEVHLIPLPGNMLVPDSHYLKLLNEQQEIARNAVEKAEASLHASNPGLTVNTEIINGRAKEVILDEAEKWDADLIVLGSHGYGTLQRFLLGSVSQAVAMHAHCSVEIVRGRE